MNTKELEDRISKMKAASPFAALEEASDNLRAHCIVLVNTSADIRDRLLSGWSLNGKNEAGSDEGENPQGRRHDVRAVLSKKMLDDHARLMAEFNAAVERVMRTSEMDSTGVK